MLIDELCDRFLPVAAEHRVTDVRIGLGYTGVLLDNDRCGLAYTFRQDSGHGCCAFRDAGTLRGKSAAELLRCAKAPDVISAAISLATINALTNPPLEGTADGLALLRLEPKDEVGMVGYFGPLVEPLKKRCKTLHIFERVPHRGADVLSEEAAAEVLPHCDVAIITATSLLNRTLDQLLEHCSSAREVMLLGPSTPFIPEVFASNGVTILSGMRVMDPARALQVISEGGGTMNLLLSMRKISMRIS